MSTVANCQACGFVAPILSYCPVCGAFISVRIVHVIGPLGEAKCQQPECGSLDVVKRGSWDCGPFYWECEDCGHQWGFA